MSENRGIAEGKTKIIYQDIWEKDQVIIENKDTITAGDGARVDTIPGKGRMATLSASNVFRLLGSHGIESHFIEQVSPKRFRATKLDMIPLEVVVRRYACGSYIQRYPDVMSGQKLGQLAVEFFAKDDRLHDPLVEHDYANSTVSRYDAHKSRIGLRSIDQIPVPMQLSPFRLKNEDRNYIESNAVCSFEVIEEEFARQGFSLVDIKTEYGYDPAHRLIIGGTIDTNQMNLRRDGESGQMTDSDPFRKVQTPTDAVEVFEGVARITIDF